MTKQRRNSRARSRNSDRIDPVPDHLISRPPRFSNEYIAGAKIERLDAKEPFTPATYDESQKSNERDQLARMALAKVQSNLHQD